MHNRWKPNVTVAAVVERDGRFLLVEERTADGLRLNNPAGHLDPGESLADACVRETLEETAWHFRPTALVGVYLSRIARPPGAPGKPTHVTYLRFTCCGELGAHVNGRRLDHGILRTVWMTPDEIRSSSARLRSPVVLQCMEDYLGGARFALDLLHADLSADFDHGSPDPA